MLPRFGQMLFAVGIDLALGHALRVRAARHLLRHRGRRARRSRPLQSGAASPSFMSSSANPSFLRLTVATYIREVGRGHFAR